MSITRLSEPAISPPPRDRRGRQARLGTGEDGGGLVALVVCVVLAALILAVRRDNWLARGFGLACVAGRAVRRRRGGLDVRAGLGRLDLCDGLDVRAGLVEDQQVAEDRLVDGQGALDLGHTRAVDPDVQKHVVPVAEVVDLVGEPASAPARAAHDRAADTADQLLDGLRRTLERLVVELRPGDVHQLVVAHHARTSFPVGLRHPDLMRRRGGWRAAPDAGKLLAWVSPWTARA